MSINGDQIPVVSVDVVSMGPANIFTLPDKKFTDENGMFSITFPNPGLYALKIRGVFHKSVNIPLMIYDQDQISVLIYLVPNSYNDGEYFDQQVYLEWIRAFGNFNDYDFFSGEIFRRNDDGSISAFIKTDLDTIRYQVRGLSSGVSVLPGADDYAARGTDFEAVIYNTSDADSVELRFHPDEKQPYSHALPGGPASRQVPLNAFVHFEESSDKFWSLPLSRVRTSRNYYQHISEPADSGLPEKILRGSFFRSYDFYSATQMSALSDSVIKDLETDNLHPQQRSALLISYVGLLEQQRSMREYLRRTNQDIPDIHIQDWIFDEIFKSVDPRNPVWALNNEAPLVLLEETYYSTDAIVYAERMIRQHTDDMIVRNLVLRLIERRAGEFDNVQDMPYYDWIVERYGENNLARRAFRTFERTHSGR